ncbi:MAG: hypothetical protein C5B50_08005 [Verrucomicrobia bacterium]|nr:MAG: hypothetical protein C5B50_08005 [Verrucomicrobiota bacterium]
MNENKHSVLSNLRELPRGAWILFFGTFLNKFGTFVLPFLAIYMTSLGYSASESGLAIGAYGCGTLIAALVGGYLADWLGRRKTIALSMFSGAAAMLLLSQARSLPAIISMACLTGLTGELYRPASSALLADLVPAGKRVTAFAAFRIAFNAGWAFGPATAGWLAKHSFQWLFLGDAATSLLFGIVAWFALPAGVRGMSAGNALGDTIRVVREDVRFRQILIAAFTALLVFMQIFSSMSLLVSKSGFSPSVYGTLLSLNGVLVVLFELPMTIVSRRFHPRHAIAIGYLLIGVAFASNLLPRTIGTLTLTLIIATCGEMMAMPVASAYVADLAPANRRGLYMGTWGLTGSLAFIFGPSLGMMLFAANPTVLWALCGVLGITAAIIISREWEIRNSGNTVRQGVIKSGLRQEDAREPFPSL